MWPLETLASHLPSLLVDNSKLLLSVVGVSALYLMRKYFKGAYCPAHLTSMNLQGQVVLVTGASKGGIGFETVKRLYLMGATVVMAVRDVNRSEKERIELEQETKNLKNKGQLIVMKVVLDDLESVRDFCKEFLNKFDRLDILVANAGLALMEGISKQGYEIAFAVNHLSHFLIVHHLKPLIVNTSVKYSKQCKIINVSSISHTFIKAPPKFTTTELSNIASPMDAYSYAKFCNVLFTKSLARQFENMNIGCYSLHPGAVNTNVFRHLPKVASVILNSISWYFFKTPESGAQTQIYLSLEKMEKLSSGSYYDNCKQVKESELSKNVELQDKLWNFSEELIKDFTN